VRFIYHRQSDVRNCVGSEAYRFDHQRRSFIANSRSLFATKCESLGIFSSGSRGADRARSSKSRKWTAAVAASRLLALLRRAFENPRLHTRRTPLTRHPVLSRGGSPRVAQVHVSIHPRFHSPNRTPLYARDSRLTRAMRTAASRTFMTAP